MRFAAKLAKALAILPEDDTVKAVMPLPQRHAKSTAIWPRQPSGVIGSPGLRHTDIMPADAAGDEDEPVAPTIQTTPATMSTSSLARDLIRVLNPYEKVETGGTPDFMAPEQARAVGPFDEDMVEYFHTLMSIYEPRIAKLWQPAVAKYKRFERECERLLTEARPRGPLARKLDRLTFTQIIDGIRRIQKVLDHVPHPGLERIRAAFNDFADYVGRVTPTISHYLNEYGLAGT
jgi:hypothetical protein